jgi:hypothetical protein
LPEWSWVNALRFVPRLVRDVAYALIARNRYRIFGRHDVCDLGGALLADRVITEGPLIRQSHEMKLTPANGRSRAE